MKHSSCKFFYRLLGIILFCFTLNLQADENSLNTLPSGKWPVGLNVLKGDAIQSQQILFSTPDDPMKNFEKNRPSIQINQKTVVYVPEGAIVKAKPIIYTHPELSDEVQKFYLQGVGNYAFWAFMVGLAAAFQ